MKLLQNGRSYHFAIDTTDDPYHGERDNRYPVVGRKRKGVFAVQVFGDNNLHLTERVPASSDTSHIVFTRHGLLVRIPGILAYNDAIFLT